jgi:putative transposase
MKMATHTQIIYHIVFGTKNRKPTLVDANRDQLDRYIWGILREKECHLYRVGGTNDHVHILCALNPSISLADLVRTIKVATTFHIKETNTFPEFSKWQEGYGGFTCSWSDRNAIIDYIRNQEEHHRDVTFAEEYESMLKRAGIEFDPKYL